MNSIIGVGVVCYIKKIIFDFFISFFIDLNYLQMKGDILEMK